MNGETIYRPDVRLRLVGSRPFFGPGPASLLRLIRECGSVAAACERMRLSYSKGRGILRVLERELGCPVVLRAQGGLGGGSASLTPEGERLLEAYTQYEEMVRRYAQSRFDILRDALMARK